MSALREEGYAYGPGPWDTEPDRLEFYHKGLPCLMRRTQLGAWCGYVAVPPGHPYHGKGLEVDLSAHGGITYAHGCAGEICHKAKPGESDEVWWFGFDCAHCWDLIPWMDAFRKETADLIEIPKDVGATITQMHMRDEYRDVDYVKSECMSLAEQLVGVKWPSYWQRLLLAARALWARWSV